MKAILAVNELTPQKKKGIMFVVFILGLVQNFSSNMFNTTGTAIVAQLSGVEYYTLQFTIFTLVSGIFIPCSAIWEISRAAAAGLPSAPRCLWSAR